MLGGQHPRIYWPPRGSDFLTGPLREAGGQGLSPGGQLGAACGPSLPVASAETIKGHPLSYSGVSSAWLRLPTSEPPIH